MYQLATQPQSIGKVLDNSMRLFTASFSKIFVLVLIMVVVSAAPYLMEPTLNFDFEQPTSTTYSLITIFWFIPMLIIIFTCYGAIYARIGAIMHNRELSLLDSLKIGIKKLVPIIVASLLYVLAIFGGMILLIIPGFILMLTLLFYMPLIASEDEGILSSLKRSHRLVWGNWWRTTSVFVVPGFIIIAVLLLMVSIIGIAIGIPNMDIKVIALVENLASSLSSLITTPFLCAVLVSQLHDLKLRKEGGDLAARIDG